MQVEVLWRCPDCGVEKVREDRGSYKRSYERYTDYELFKRNRGCTHPKAVCQVCHRPLSQHTSLERGVGPVCWAKRQEVEEDHSLAEEQQRSKTHRQRRRLNLLRLKCIAT